MRRLRMIRKANRRRKASGFEKDVYALLKAERIPFVKEKSVGRCHVDIMIGDKMAVELQGCHWHSCKKCFPKPSKWQKAALARDGRRFYFFTKLGFEVTQIWECEFRKNPDSVLTKLKSLYKRCK